MGPFPYLECLPMGHTTPTSLIKKRPTFTITCAVFATIGFAQLMALGVAVVLRSGETRVVEKIVPGDPIIVSIPTLPDEPEQAPEEIPVGDAAAIEKKYAGNFIPQVAPSPDNEVKRLSTIEAPSDLVQHTPAVSNARVKQLVDEAYELQLQGDLVRATVKLEEAEDLDPKEPAVYYYKAMLFEDMGNWQLAGDNYEKLFAMGPSIGAYYHRAAVKLSHGVAGADANRGLMLLGNIIQRVDGDRLGARLVIPIRAAMDEEIDPNQIEVKVNIYDIVDGKTIEPVPAARQDNISSHWLSLPADWQDQGEELLECTYKLPPIRLAEAHIFGERKYFGHVTELYYKGELLDQQASPRRLHAIHAKKNAAPNLEMPFDFGQEEFLPNINPDNPLLPPLPRN